MFSKYFICATLKNIKESCINCRDSKKPKKKLGESTLDYEYSFRLNLRMLAHLVERWFAEQFILSIFDFRSLLEILFNF